MAEKKEADGMHPASDYAYAPDKEQVSTWKLRIDSPHHVAAATAALGPGGFRGNKVQIPEEGVSAVKRKVRAAYKKFFPDNEIPEVIKAASAKNKKETFDEEMVSYEVVYEPYTMDAHDQWMSADTIEKACADFNKNLEDGIVKSNLFHMQDTEAFTIESTWIQKELDVKVVQTGELIKAGTWVAKIKYNDETLWELKKQGVIGGVSIGARGHVDNETGEITDLTFNFNNEDEE